MSPALLVLSFLIRLAAVVLVMIGLAPLGAAAGDRTGIPLKNWGGFSEYQDAAYEDLERLVTAGLADRVVLNTRPISRIEAAKMVARAIKKIRGDENGDLNARRDLEPVLDRLMEEFKVELASLGVKVGETAPTVPGAVSFTPVDRAQAWFGLASRDFSLVNQQGRTLKRSANAGLTFESRAQIGDVLTLYAQPEVHGTQEFGQARLAAGYAKLTLFNVELLVGRDSLAWGPGYHNGLMLTNNAAPLDQIRLGSAEAFVLPWIGQWIGPMKALIFLAQLEERRDRSHAKLSGMRLTVTPFSFLEIGAIRAVMFDGCCPRLPTRRYPNVILDPQFGDVRARPEEATNNLFGVDADIRIRNVDRLLPMARDIRFYGEFYWDDVCGECGPAAGIGHFLASNLLPKGSTVGIVAGVHLMGLFGIDWLDWRAEFAKTSPLSFNNDQFPTGYATRGHVISDFIGTDGQDHFARLGARITSDLQIGVEIERAIVGSTVNGFVGPQQRRTGGGVDVSYRFGQRYSLYVQYLAADVKNRQFRPGNDGGEHALRLELTRSFR